jgi:hypothetical protein
MQTTSRVFFDFWADLSGELLSMLIYNLKSENGIEVFPTIARLHPPLSELYCGILAFCICHAHRKGV